MPKFLKHVTILTNVYIRLSRGRLKGKGEDSRVALTVLLTVVMTTIRLFAPFAPFFTEFIFQELNKMMMGECPESIHHTLLPRPIGSLIDAGTEVVVSDMITILDLSRQIRTRMNVPLKYPVEKTYIIDKQGRLEERLRPLMHYIHQEVNSFDIVFTQDFTSLNIRRIVKPDYRKLGPRCRSCLPDITRILSELSDADFDKICECGYLDMPGDIRVLLDEMSVSYQLGSGDMPEYSIAFDNYVVLLLDLLDWGCYEMLAVGGV
ncbi:isoleucine--tRNA ligase, cytoplasmic-like [Octopus sinensis]|uniref:Isoleucine--tRNA ligase, cytoplasmic-like n=1 Tax=Octopus sinensis TaxID=2607531 RepID=A0A6P7TSL0_9MOLL|nr:isoleucine--tRNA ligase, cytoplasmic-like [Octopus sinensis]